MCRILTAFLYYDTLLFKTHEASGVSRFRTHESVHGEDKAQEDLAVPSKQITSLCSETEKQSLSGI